MVTFELTDQVRETIQQTLYQLLGMRSEARSWAEPGVGLLQPQPGGDGGDLLVGLGVAVGLADHGHDAGDDEVRPRRR